jgi:urease accessory protein
MKLHRFSPLLLLGASLAASAHVGGDGSGHHGFMAGFSHPFFGLDHLAAMLAVGVWSALAARHIGAALMPVVAFALTLLAGALLAQAGLPFPAVEPMIAASLLVVGLLLTVRARLSAPTAAALVAVFALFHGAAHGHEIAGTPALAGMVLGTALLHGAGLLLGRWLQHRHVLLARAIGFIVAGFGLFTGAMLVGG